MTFSSMSVRDELLSESINIRKKGLYINEYLTKENSKLMYDLRQIRKTTDNSIPLAIFSRGGVACYRLFDESIQRVFHPDDLKKLEVRLVQLKNQNEASQPSGTELRRSERLKN